MSRKRLDQAVLNQTEIVSEITKFGMERKFDEDDFIGALEVIINIHKSKQNPATISISGLTVNAAPTVDSIISLLNNPDVKADVARIVKRSLTDALQQSGENNGQPC